ncbi:deleted in malignant brain tumors 1 protein-like isoform X2 [Rhinatrema bivittatum]|uniref:deleted in malignant brain tumors 1 protein-like isoform X2 n=1 Tax=Rhinatrema bivittatum TaxID=194408 RepID=UPI00112945C5|nr:deleted in malignant brain tumors 1 protein-like isoform X2 [Rhinatrema bivittatum]
MTVGDCMDDLWDINDAKVVCKQLNCGLSVTAPGRAKFGEGSGPIWLDDIKCVGNESHLGQCEAQIWGKHNCLHKEDAGVVCSDVALFDGFNECAGRVQVAHEDQWTTVCDHGWELQDAQVVCKDIGCGFAISATGAARFGEGTDSIWLSDVDCKGTESKITDCLASRGNKPNCSHAEDASAVCTGNLPKPTMSRSPLYILFNRGDNVQLKCTIPLLYTQSTVYFYKENVSNPIAMKTLSSEEVTVNHTLNELETSDSGRYTCQYEISLPGQSFRSPESEPVKVIISKMPIRLANGTHRCAGRVEIFYNDEWGTVCDDFWDTDDAAVVCKQLDCGIALSALRRARFGKGAGPIWLETLSCSGNEPLLSECQTQEKRRKLCSHDEDASVVCSDLRLLGGPGRCAGRVEVLHNDQWGRVCGHNWELQDAQVVCSILQCGHALSAVGSAHFGPGSGTFWLEDVNCDGTEISFSKCQSTFSTGDGCSHATDATVICSEGILHPNISMEPPSGEMSQGQTLVIRCTVIDVYQRLTFLLHQATNDTDLLLNATASNGSATFILTDVNSTRTGNYTCQYVAHIEGRDFHSPHSQPLQVTLLPSPTDYMNLRDMIDCDESNNTFHDIKPTYKRREFTAAEDGATNQDNSVTSTNSVNENILNYVPSANSVDREMLLHDKRK